MRYVILFLVSTGVFADPYGPFNQQYTFNQQYGSTNWYSSPLGMGVAQAGVTLIGGLVNAMSRPDPVVVPQQSQPIYVNGNASYAPQGGSPAYGGYPNQGYPNQGYANQGYAPRSASAGYSGGYMVPGYGYGPNCYYEQSNPGAYGNMPNRVCSGP